MALNSLGELSVKLSADLSKFTKNLRTATNKIKDFTKTGKTNLRQLSAEFDQLGRAANRVALAMGVAIAGTVREYAKFEKSMRKATAVTRLTDKEFKMMSDTAEKMSVELNFAANKAADAFYFLGSAGLSVNEQMQAFVPTLTMAKAATIEAAEAADILVGTIRGFRMEFTDTAHVTDVMTRAVTSSNMNFTQLGQTLSMISGTASNMNNSLEDTISMIATLADVNIRGTRAGVTLRRSMLNIANPSPEVNSIFRQYAVDVYDAQRRMKPFIQIVAELGKALENVTEQEKNRVFETIFGARAIAGQIAIFDKAAENLGKFSNELANAGGAAEEMAKKQMMALTEQMGTVWRRIQQVSRSLGQTLEPAIRKIVKAINPLLDALETWIHANPELASKMSLLAVKIALVATAIGALVTTVKLLTFVFGPLIKIIGIFVGSISGAFLGIIAAAAVAVVSIQFMRDKWHDAGLNIKDEWNDWVKLMKFGIEKISGWWKTFVDWMTKIYNKSIGKLVAFWKGYANTVISTIMYIKNVGKNLFDDKDGILPETFYKDWIGDFVDKSQDWTSDKLKLWGTSIKDKFIEWGTKVGPAVKNALSSWFEGAKGQTARDIDSVVSMLKAKFPELANQIEEFKKVLSESAMPTYGEPSSGKGGTYTPPDSGKGKSLFSEGLQAYYEGIKDFRSFVIESMASMLSSIESSISQAFEDLIMNAESFSDAMDNMLRAIHQSLARMFADMMARQLMTSMVSPFITPTTVPANVSHSGGIVGTTGFPKRFVPMGLFNSAPRLHNGLRSDEFPTILQKGEEVIPAGETRGRGTNVNIVVSAIDGKNAYQFLASHKREIASLIGEASRNNHPVRRGSK